MLTNDSRKSRLTSAMRRPFTEDEDTKLLEIMTTVVKVNWEQIAANFYCRTARQCRERWTNYLNPSIRTGPWTEDEDNLLLEKVNELGRCWSSIRKFFNGRSDNDIKNRWYSHLKYKTVENNGKLNFVSDPSESPFPDRKTRKRIKESPQQNALRKLEQQKRMKIAESGIQLPFSQLQNSISPLQMNQSYSFYSNLAKQQVFFNQPLSFQLFQQQQQQYQFQNLMQQQQMLQMYQIQNHKASIDLSNSSRLFDKANDESTNKIDHLDAEFDDEAEIAKPEFIDFWEPNLFDEASLMENSMNSKGELNDNVLY